MSGSRSPFSGSRRRFPAGDNNTDITQGSPAIHMPQRRRLSPIDQDSDSTEVSNEPQIQANIPRRRRQRPGSGEQGLETEQTHSTQAVPEVPVVPQASAQSKSKSVGSESLLEAIIKLVNSILTFKK